MFSVSLLENIGIVLTFVYFGQRLNQFADVCHSLCQKFAFTHCIYISFFLCVCVCVLAVCGACKLQLVGQLLELLQREIMRDKRYQSCLQRAVRCGALLSGAIYCAYVFCE